MITKHLQRLNEREPLDPELQRYLTERGYYGRTAKCLNWKLVGVERPGWVQVFEFHVRAKRTSGQWEEKFGICRTDERDDTYQIELFDDQATCRQAAVAGTTGMITGGRGPGHPVKTFLMLLFLAAISVAATGALISIVNRGN
jgi:hypothetical protein